LVVLGRQQHLAVQLEQADLRVEDALAVGVPDGDGGGGPEPPPPRARPPGGEGALAVGGPDGDVVGGPEPLEQRAGPPELLDQSLDGRVAAPPRPGGPQAGDTGQPPPPPGL